MAKSKRKLFNGPFRTSAHKYHLVEYKAVKMCREGVNGGGGPQRRKRYRNRRIMYSLRGEIPI